jgi:hypothetical protein
MFAKIRNLKKFKFYESSGEKKNLVDPYKSLNPLNLEQTKKSPKVSRKIQFFWGKKKHFCKPYQKSTKIKAFILKSFVRNRQKIFIPLFIL